MHGNVWEWCEDLWHENYQGVPTNGSAWLEGGEQNRHIVRGGSWTSNERISRSAFRNKLDAYYRDCNIGFRVVI